MKAGWQDKPLSEVLVKTETVNPSLKPNREFEYIDVSSVSNTTFQIDQTQTLKGKDAPSRARKLVKTNDILFATIRPTLQRIALVPEELDQQVCSTGYFVLRPKEGLHYRFLYYYLFTNTFMGAMETLQKGASYPAVTDAEVRGQYISYPPLPEQQRIVTILDKAFDGIAAGAANAEKNLSNAREVFECYLKRTLRDPKYPIKNLGELCTDVEYGTSSKSQAKGKIPVLRMGNIQQGKLDWSDLVYSSDKTEIKKYTLRYNDVLFNRTNSPELVGKTAIFKGEMPAIFAGYLIRINRIDSLLDPDYLCYFLNSSDAIAYGKTVVISSVNQANINGTKLKTYPIPAPPVSVQKEIVAKLNDLATEVEGLEAVYQQKLDALAELKKSILHQAFTGQLH